MMLYPVLLLFLLCLPGAAMRGPPPTLNPTTYVSASGDMELFVNPSDMYGRGPAEYRLLRDGQPVWTRQLPFTLWQAVVADCGFAAGFAYPALAFDGHQIVVRNKNQLWFYHPCGQPNGVFSFETEDQTKNWAGPFLAKEGSEIWFVAPNDLTVHRYARPKW